MSLVYSITEDNKIPIQKKLSIASKIVISARVERKLLNFAPNSTPTMSTVPNSRNARVVCSSRHPRKYSLLGAGDNNSISSVPSLNSVINALILIGTNAVNQKEFLMTFIFYLLFVPAVAGILNKIMYVSESFMQINGNVARMDEIFNIPVLKDTQISKTFDNDNVTFDNVSFSYTGKENELAIKNVSFEAKQGEITAIVGLSGGGKSTILI